MDNITKIYISMYEEKSEYALHDMTNKDHAEQAMKLGVDEFSQHTGGNRFIAQTVLSNHDPAMSRVVTHKGNVVGAYFLNKNNMTTQHATNSELYNKDIKGKQGVEGVGLVVHPDHRGMGIGKQLKDYSDTIKGHDYIWGGQLKSLKNIDDWKKSRKVIGDHPGIYFTYKNLK